MSGSVTDQTQVISEKIKAVETEVQTAIQNINEELDKLDTTIAIDSLNRLQEAVKDSGIDEFGKKIADLQQTFLELHKSVEIASDSVAGLSDNTDKLQSIEIEKKIEIDNSVNIGEVDKSVNIDLSNLGDTFNALSGSLKELGQVFSNMTGTIQTFGQAFIDVGTGISIACGGIADLFTSVGALGQGIISAATGISMIIPLLPALGAAMLEMAVSLSGITEYIGSLIIFLGVLYVLSLLGEGLMAAGLGLLNIGSGLTSMTEGMTALLTFMPLFIESLAGITDNVGGIILFVLLAVAMLAMATAIQMMNGQMTQFVDNMIKLTGLMSVGFVAAFTVFAIMLIAMSLFMDKVANGIKKITDAIGQQIAKLVVLNPLLAAQAILSNPFMGAATVALAIAGGLLVKALLPAMATGGVVSSPTVAMVGEGRYPEAVVPLGDSPQFASMKADIANAVLTAMNASGESRNGRAIELTVNLDSRVMAKQLYSPLQLEAQRRG